MSEILYFNDILLLLLFFPRRTYTSHSFTLSRTFSHACDESYEKINRKKKIDDDDGNNEIVERKVFSDNSCLLNEWMTIDKGWKISFSDKIYQLMPKVWRKSSKALKSHSRNLRF